MNTESFNKEACLLGWKRWFALRLMVFNCWLKVKLSHISEIKTIHSEAGTLLADGIQTYHHHSLKQADHNPDLLFCSLQNEEEWGFAWLTSTNRVSAAGWERPHLRYLHSQVFGIYCFTQVRTLVQTLLLLSFSFAALYPKEVLFNWQNCNGTSE